MGFVLAEKRLVRLNLYNLLLLMLFFSTIYKSIFLICQNYYYYVTAIYLNGIEKCDQRARSILKHSFFPKLILFITNESLTQDLSVFQRSTASTSRIKNELGFEHVGFSCYDLN